MATANWLFAEGSLSMNGKAAIAADKAIQELGNLAQKFEKHSRQLVLDEAPGLYEGPVNNESAAIALALEAAATFLWGALWGGDEHRAELRNMLLEIMSN